MPRRASRESSAPSKPRTCTPSRGGAGRRCHPPAAPSHTPGSAPTRPFQRAPQASSHTRTAVDRIPSPAPARSTTPPARDHPPRSAASSPVAAEWSVRRTRRKTIAPLRRASTRQPRACTCLAHAVGGRAEADGSEGLAVTCRSPQIITDATPNATIVGTSRTTTMEYQPNAAKTKYGASAMMSTTTHNDLLGTPGRRRVTRLRTSR